MVNIKLLECLNIRKMSILELSNISGISKSTLYDILNGVHMPSIETLASLLKALNIKSNNELIDFY